MPLGAALARIESLKPDWLHDEGRHGVIAFGGGALFAAVALVLVPEGADRLPAVPAVFLFLLGGVSFAALDRLIAGRKGPGAQFIAMLSDFLPEAAALGALLAGDPGTGILLMCIIILQNIPEAFNACREMMATNPTARTLPFFLMLVPLGPLAAWLGHDLLMEAPYWLGGVMIFAGGGILYLIFEDIAPQVRLEKTWLPPLGGILGFALGLAGHLAMSG